ncbi:MAG: GntR family transcriptional regulator [Rhodospirillales bacterium]|jgi:DNA-binding GntR family transcriptional regulator|nr:GntR family transcriptional regulator [Rhodospirillales bacterium]
MLKISENQENPDTGLNEEQIVDRIFEAVIEQRLPPGTKLSETVLCDAFGVGRMRIRRSLLLLASRNIVDLQSNRGAYISSPTPQQAREVFETRRAIEPNVCRIAVERATDRDIRSLEKHLKKEHAAHSAGDRRLSIRLSGLFHVKLAEIAVNEVMERIVKELVTRTSLIIGMFGAAGTANCHSDEHAALLNAFKSRQQGDAALQMIAHLENIETQVDLSTDRESQVDLVEIFGQE